MEVNKDYCINNQLSGIYNNWGFAFSRLGRFEDAADKFKNAKKKNRRNGLAHKNLGFALSKLGKDEEAIESYRDAIQIYKEALKYCRDSSQIISKISQISKISICIGFSFTLLGKFAEAIERYESIINDKSQEISTKCEAYYEWANTLDEMGKSEDAMKKLNEALKLQESSDKQSDIRLLNRKGLLHYHKKKYKEANELFEEIINRDPSYGFAFINKGLVYNQRENIKSKNDSLISSNLSHQPETDKTEIETVEKRLMRCQDDIDTYQRTLTEIRKILKNLETNEKNSLLKWDDQKDKYEFYEEGIIIVQESSYLRHDYIDIYKREAQKIKNRLRSCKKEEEDLSAKIEKMKTELSNSKYVDQKNDLNKSVLGNSMEIQGKPPGF